MEVRIADEKGQVVEQGEIGEVNVRGYTVFPGYVKDPEKTAENFHADGWWRTGDLGRIEGKLIRIQLLSYSSFLPNGNLFNFQVESSS